MWKPKLGLPSLQMRRGRASSCVDSLSQRFWSPPLLEVLASHPTKLQGQGSAHVYYGLSSQLCTEIGKSIGTWFGEICSCPCFASRNKFHQTTYQYFSLSLYCLIFVNLLIIRVKAFLCEIKLAINLEWVSSSRPVCVPFLPRMNLL